ncbi:hypothetical protein [Streptomyces collinus]|uniref:hypothetical protein n=1 Tax=Streptomyces collinus TaxID=42684 RepID=UPI0033C8AF90
MDAAARAVRTGHILDLQALTGRVIKIVKAEVRLGQLLPLDDPARDLRIAENVAAKVLRQAADAVTGAWAAACRLTPANDGTGVRATMRLITAVDCPLPERVHEVRRSVFHAALHDLALPLTAVDITVTDISEPEPGPGLGPGRGLGPAVGPAPGPEPPGHPGLPTGGGA